jgi:predicted PurR-regulated permease PerM
MNAGQLAALIAAAFFAVAMCAAVYVLVRLARLISAATSLVTSYQAGAEDVLARSRAAVERADQQLARTGAMADGVDAVAASISDLSVQVSAVAGTAKLIASGLGTPVLRLAAAGHGVRHALAVRRTARAAGIRARRETWQERTERVRAARDRAVLDQAGLDRAVLDRSGR